MSTELKIPDLSEALIPKVRRAVLSFLYTHVDEEFYMRQIARVTGTPLGSVQREVKRLESAGIILREKRGNQVYFRANPACPLFEELRSLVVKTAGLADVLRAALEPLAGRIDAAFVFGSFATGDETRASDVDILVIGEATFAEVVSAFAPAQKTLAREVNPSVMPAAEFRSRLAAGDRFLSNVVSNPVLFIIGDKDELAKLAE